MKKIRNYTIGWDPVHKTGYLRAELDDGTSLLLENLNTQELTIIIHLLKTPPVYSDQAGWLISGWINTDQSVNESMINTK